MSFKSTLAFVLLLVGTQSFAATYHCSLSPELERTEHHSNIYIETTKDSINVVTQDARFESINKTFLKVSTPNAQEITVFSGWTNNKLVTVLLPSYVLETTVNDLFKMDVALQVMPDETAIVGASYLCTKKYF